MLLMIGGLLNVGSLYVVTDNAGTREPVCPFWPGQDRFVCVCARVWSFQMRSQSPPVARMCVCVCRHNVLNRECSLGTHFTTLGRIPGKREKEYFYLTRPIPGIENYKIISHNFYWSYWTYFELKNEWSNLRTVPLKSSESESLSGITPKEKKNTRNIIIGDNSTTGNHM